MRVTFFISFGLMAILGAGQASGQSAFLDNGQDGTSIGLFHTSQDRIKGYGVAVSFSANGQADISASIASVGDRSRSRLLVIGLGGAPYLRLDTEGGISILLGAPLGVAFATSTGSSHTAMLGVASEVAFPTGCRARLVFSGGLSYHLLFDKASENSTVWTVGMGQSIWSKSSSVVFGVSLSHPISGNGNSQFAVHLDFLFAR